MPYEVTRPNGAGYVRVTVTGPMSRDVAAEVGVAAARLAEGEPLPRYLYDLRGSVNVESILANYQFVHADMPRMRFAPAARVAMLVAPDDHSHDFIETLSINQGYSVRIFRDDEGAAVRWLEA